MFERFTDRARAVLVEAGNVAREHKSPSIRRHHILVALIDAADDGSQVVSAVLDDAGVDRAALRAALITSLTSSEVATGTGTEKLPFTAEAKKALELSLREALSLGHNYIGREHLLLGVLRDPDGPLAHVLAETNLKYGRARDLVREQSPPSRRSRRGPRIRTRAATHSTLETVIRRTYERSSGRPATTGDLLVALLETPGTHFHALLEGVPLPTVTKVTADLELLLQASTPDGIEDSVRVDPRGGVTINDPRIAEAVKDLIGDGPVTTEKLQEILRRLQG
jgi:ATP-dependent Clp protease ATP-binding subunit ClpA